MFLNIFFGNHSSYCKTCLLQPQFLQLGCREETHCQPTAMMLPLFEVCLSLGHALPQTPPRYYKKEANTKVILSPWGWHTENTLRGGALTWEHSDDTNVPLGARRGTRPVNPPLGRPESGTSISSRPISDAFGLKRFFVAQGEKKLSWFHLSVRRLVPWGVKLITLVRYFSVQLFGWTLLLHRIINMMYASLIRVNAGIFYAKFMKKTPLTMRR